jgi:hypothetical protein
MTMLKFTRRPNPVLPEHRPIYKITQVLLILSYSRGGKSSLLRLHLLNWVLKSSQRIQKLRNAIQSGSLSLPTWGFDPALVVALRFAQAEKLLIQVSNGYKIEEKGRRFVKDVLKDPTILESERTALAEIGRGISEGMVESVAKNWN